MSLSMHHVVFDCEKPSVLVDFWAETLGYEKEEWGDEIGAMAFNPKDRQVRLLFFPVPERKETKNRVHIDVETEDTTMQDEVERLVSLGATVVEQKEMHTDAWSVVWTIMLDPEGNEFCVAAKPLMPQPR